MKNIADSVHGVTTLAFGIIGVVSLTDLELIIKIIVTLVVGSITAGYTLWKWRKEIKKSERS